MQNATFHGSYTGLYDGFQTLSDNLYEQYGQDYSTGNTVSFATVFGKYFSK